MKKDELQAKFAKEMYDDELDHVAGGTVSEEEDDLYLLCYLNPSGAREIMDNYKVGSENRGERVAFQNALAAKLRVFGIEVNYGGSVTYEYGDFTTLPQALIGEESDKKHISREEIWAKVYKRHA